MRTRHVPFLLCLLASTAISTAIAGSALAAGDDSATAVSGVATAALQQLFAEEWAFRLEEYPLYATAVGHSAYNDRLPKVSEADEARRTDRRRHFLARLEQIDRQQLARQDRISYEMMHRELREAIEEFELGQHLMPLTVDDGFHISFAMLPNDVPLSTVADYDAYLARLTAFLDYVDGHVALLRLGLERGMTLARVVLDGYEVTIASHVVEDVTESVFWAPFAAFPTTFASADRERLTAAGRRAIAESVVPGYRRFLDFMVEEYIPGARQSLGASELPRGREYYAHRIRHFTTLDLSAEEIHQLGLKEVERIRGEMQRVIEQVGFAGDFAAFLQFLRTDPRFYAKTPEELLKQASYISKRMDGKLPALFKTLPRLPYTVAPVPDHLAPKYTGGRYIGAAPGGTQPGYYWVNTYALDSRPLYILEALSFHEAVPGHHLQIALNQELEELPDFRRHTYLSAFGEGWGLYSEWLGLEAGFYTDPYSNFGRLTYEMWRACRLVVDTGLHAMGWSRQQVMDYLASHTALSLHEVRTETDRYIAWPGQALAYKLGELKIRELRRQAEERLGEGFDVREFHDAVLGNGSVPLAVLEEVIGDFIARRVAQL